MPAMLEDPTAAPIHRTSGASPFPDPANPSIPASITPRQVTLRDRITIASLLPFSTASDVPPRLLSYLCNQFNLEIEKGDTYPMTDSMSIEHFGRYWFQNFGAVMLLGEVYGTDEVRRLEEQGTRWEEVCLGSFYVKPNYPGRSSHVCNGGFLVTEAARNKGVGRLMGEEYLEWAPKLGYTYSVFNLVYETNVVSCRIWDALGFKRIGRVKGCGNLRSSPDELVDAIIYGRDLGPSGEDYVSEERFDKIRYYLKHGKYPDGADRAEKSRLRSAATHYKLLPAEDGNEGEDGERLMLKDKEVVSDPQRQYQIAREIHAEQHGGINKTTATIAEKYHWVRIKETVSLVIKNCPDCKESPQKAPVMRTNPTSTNETSEQPLAVISPTRRDPAPAPDSPQFIVDHIMQYANTHPAQTLPSSRTTNPLMDQQASHAPPPLATVANMRAMENYAAGMPLDPRIMSGAVAVPPHAHDFSEGMRQVAEYSRSTDAPSFGQDAPSFDPDEMNIGDGEKLQRQTNTRLTASQGEPDGMQYQEEAEEEMSDALANGQREASLELPVHFEIEQNE